MEKNGIIELDGMEFRAFHGCLDSEKENGNTFTVDFRGMTDMSKAASDDRLENTADYGILYRIIAGEMEKRSDLLEHVAGRIVKAIEKDPNDVDYYGSASYAYSKMEKFELSLEYANRGILVDKNDAYIHFRKGWALQELGKCELAIKSYEKCIEYNESYFDAYANISYCYSKIGDMKKSILYANKAILINKDYAYAHYRKGWGLHFLGKFEDAIEAYESALELDPTDSFSYIGLAASSLNIQEAAKALIAANKAIMLDRNCGEAYYFKGLALSNLGKTKEAEISYAKAAALGYS